MLALIFQVKLFDILVFLYHGALKIKLGEHSE